MKRLLTLIVFVVAMSAAVSCSCNRNTVKESCTAGQCAGCEDKESCSSCTEDEECDHVCDSTSVKDSFYKKK